MRGVATRLTDTDFYRAFPDEASTFSRSSESTSDYVFSGSPSKLGSSVTRTSTGTKPPAVPASILKPTFSSLGQNNSPRAVGAESPSLFSSMQGSRLPALKLSRGPRGPATTWAEDAEEDQEMDGSVGTHTGVVVGSSLLTSKRASPGFPAGPIAPSLSPALVPGDNTLTSSTDSGGQYRHQEQADPGPPASISAKARNLLGSQSPNHNGDRAGADGLPVLPSPAASTGMSMSEFGGGRAVAHQAASATDASEGGHTSGTTKDRGKGMMKRLSTLVRRDSTR